MRSRILRGSALALSLVLVAWLATRASAERQLGCSSFPTLLSRYFEQHVQYRRLTPELAERIATHYVSRIDPSKSLMLAADAEQIVGRVKKFLASEEDARCTISKEIKKSLLEWHKDSEAETRRMVGQKGLEIDKTITLQVDPDKRPHPKTRKELSELRRKLVHFQLANYVVSGTELEEAKKRLIHRYELNVRRIGELDEVDVYSDLLDSFASALDPHSSYFSADALEDFRIAMGLSLEGIGAALRSEDGYTIVEEIVPGGAADRHGGLRPKDRILSVAQGEKAEAVDVIDMALRDVVRMIRGEKGTKVKLTVLRQGATTETLSFTIVRDKIDLKEQAAKLRWEEHELKGKKLKLAVLELPSFYGGNEPGTRQCEEDVERLLREVNEKRADGLLLDLSRNGGGLLQAAVDISGFFIREGPVVSVDGPRSKGQVLEDEDERVHYRGPLVVLVSRASASASEILAGALKDYGRAVIVGDDHTFGKGTVQELVNLPPGLGALKVTTALFFRPGGESTQSQGVPSDIVVPSIFNTDDFGEKEQPFALPPRKTDPFRGKKANFDEDPLRGWRPVSSSEIANLAKRSSERIAKDAEIQKILERLEKTKKNEGILKLSDVLEDGKKGKSEEDEEDLDGDDKELSPRAKEALHVLADLVSGG